MPLFRCAIPMLTETVCALRGLLPRERPARSLDPSLYGGPVNWQIAFNNDTFVPPASLLERHPAALLRRSGLRTDTDVRRGQPLHPADDHQWRESVLLVPIRIRYHHSSSMPVCLWIRVIGGTTKQLNDVVVAFPPNTAGQLNVSSTPDAVMTSAWATDRIHHHGASNAGPGVDEQRSVERSVAFRKWCELVDQPRL